eukprot:GHRQ01023843.1.p2 GENE.GHRQ01023843.1~~GHRQ01023843.1.p2  ORF type:complete len:141 (-),score=15.72 GHRQ01023843.1:219-641(-)
MSCCLLQSPPHVLCLQVMQHMSKCFQAIDKLKLEDESPPAGQRPKALGMVSCVGDEYVGFKQPLPLEDKASWGWQLHTAGGVYTLLLGQHMQNPVLTVPCDVFCSPGNRHGCLQTLGSELLQMFTYVMCMAVCHCRLKDT